MSQIGRYELLRELSRSRYATVYAAKQVGGDPPAAAAGAPAPAAGAQYAVKVFDVESFGLLESMAAGETFLESAGLQKRLAEHGAKHWAPVLEMGDVDQAFHVTELFPLTAERVVNRQANVGVRGLYTVVWSVVRGLTELRETFRRAHGNLKLSNVLIGGDETLASPRTTRVVLTDASAEAASARDRSADLLAIGELIHQLVLRRPFKPDPSAPPPPPPEVAGPEDPEDDTISIAPTPAAAGVWPVPMSPAWAKLGPDAKRWLELCNWLLSPSPADRPVDLVELAVTLNGLQPKPDRRKPLKWAAAVVLPLAAIGAGVGGFYVANANVHAEVEAIGQQWFGKFEQSLTDEARLKKLAEAEDGPREAAAALRQARAQGVRFDVDKDSMLSYGAYRNAKAALDAARRVEAGLGPDRWSGLSSLVALQQRYEARGWRQPAVYLGDLIRGVRPGSSATDPSAPTDLALAVERLVAAAPKVRQDAGFLEENWAKYDADVRTVEKAAGDDRVLSSFARWLRESAGASLRLTDAGFDRDGMAALARRQPLATDLAKVVASGWPGNVARDRLASDVDSGLNLVDPNEKDVKLWLTSVPDYVLVKPDPKAAPLAGLTTTFAKLTEDVGKQSFTADERTAYDADRAAAEKKLADLAADRFVRKDVVRGQGDLMSRAQDLTKDLANLRKQWVRLDDPLQWVASIDQLLPIRSDALKERWTAYVARQLKDAPALAKDAEAFKKVKVQADRVRDLLMELDKQFPLGPAGLQEPFLSATLAKREVELRELSNWADASGPASPVAPNLDEFSDRAKGKIDAFAAWTGKLAALAKEFPIAKEFLTPADRPDRAWAGRDKTFWEDPVVQGLVKPDVARIEALAAVASMARTDLIKAAREAEPAEVAVAAYRRLGELTDDARSAWPATAEELSADMAARNRLQGMIRAIRSDAERKAPADDWRAQGPIRWRRFANHGVLAAADKPADLEKRLQSANDFQTAMLADKAEVDKLDPAARFNYVLYLARVVVTDPSANAQTDVVVRGASDGLRRAIAAMPDRPEVQELSRRLGRVAESEPMASDVRLLAPQPPEQFVRDLTPETPLKFVRLQPPGLRPYYLCTTELSLRQFRDLVSAAGDWSVANGLLGSGPVVAGAAAPTGGAAPKPFRGPRLWDRAAEVGLPIDRFSDSTWHYDAADGSTKQFVFASPLRAKQFNKHTLKAENGGDPKPDHPMQQLPARAALYAAGIAGCRLPTTAEWTAAYEIDRKAIPAGTTPDWNLRDRAFKTQADFSAKDEPSQWPDPGLAGVFKPKGRVAAAATVATTDNTLFFRPVTEGAGTFQNLVGNVAELTCDQADAFDAVADPRSATDRRTAAGVTAFCQAYGSQVMVIGGSSLTPPMEAMVDLLRPTPIGDVTEPYADVGVRLAFTAPARSIAERLRWFLEEQKYLAPPTVAAASK